MDKRKAIYIGVGILVVGVGAFLLIRKLKRKKALSDNLGIPPEIKESSSGSGGSSSSSSWNSSPSIDEIKKTFEWGWTTGGTDEERFFTISNSLTQSQREQLVSDWDSKSAENKGTFKEWIKWEFGGIVDSNMNDNYAKAKTLYNIN